MGDNFYRFPRVDYSMLKKHNEGIIASSACLGGIYAGDFWEHREESSDAVVEAMRETSRQMIDIFGDRWYAEVQWHRIEDQHKLNKYVIQMAQEFNIKLLSTADSHYPNPAVWKQREIYTQIGWKGFQSDKELPDTVEEMLYQIVNRNLYTAPT